MEWTITDCDDCNVLVSAFDMGWIPYLRNFRVKRAVMAFRNCTVGITVEHQVVMQCLRGDRYVETKLLLGE